MFAGDENELQAQQQAQHQAQQQLYAQQQQLGAQQQHLGAQAEAVQAHVVAQAGAAQDQLALARHRDIRTRLERHAKGIGNTDGTDRESLRQWLAGVDNAKVWTNAPDAMILEMVGYLTSGSLALLLRGLLDNPPVGGNTWAGAKAAIEAAFLNEDEKEFLRSKVDKLAQTAYEDSRSYGRRFSDAVAKAYSEQELAVGLVMERLVKTFVDGLRDRTVRTQVYLAKPVDLEAAISVANNCSRAVSLAEMAPGAVGHEPMDISAIRMAGNTTNSELCNMIKALQKEVSELKDSRKRTVGPNPNSKQRRSGPRRPTAADFVDGKPKCFKCGKVGHFKKDCSTESTGDKLDRVIAALEGMVVSSSTTGTLTSSNAEN